MAKKTRRQSHSYQFKYAAVMVTEHSNILAVDVAPILGILGFYNRQRIQSGIGYLTPHQMANLAA